ncbi:MAG: ATP-binding cassette domain-containing protein [Propionivibrio sp.]
MKTLEIRNLNISRTGQTLVAGLSLRVAAGDVFTLMGASGSGKSTILNWIIGALDPAFTVSGELWLAGVRRDAAPIEARRIGILFQDDLLFPHLAVGQNLAFALPASITGRSARRLVVERTLADVGLAGFHDRDPATLSGGQKARISALRALLDEPAALVLDEPFSKLDAVLRGQFRAFVFDRIGQLGIPTLLVTHDPADVPQPEAVIELSDFCAEQGCDA